MKDPRAPEEDQWIPQEISYSLKEISHGERVKSKPNALLYVVLPDRSGSYNYFINKTLSGKVTYNDSIIFNIMWNNLNNLNDAGEGARLGLPDSYAVVVRFGDFMQDFHKYIAQAVKNWENIDYYHVRKQI